MRIGVFHHLEWTVVVCGLIMFLIRHFQGNGQLVLFLVQMTGCLLVLDAVGAADMRWHSRCNYGDTAFEGGNSLLAPAGQFQAPSPAARQAFHDRLETDRYRSALVGDWGKLPVFLAPHIGQFWQLRLLDGYSSGVPRRLAELPWPKGVISLRAMYFQSKENLPWDLLALCNVKNVVVVSPEFHCNRVVENGEPREAEPRDVEILENPRRPAPRQFLAARVKSVENGPQAVKELLALKDMAADVVADSFVEGPTADTEFDTSGPLEVSYQGDEIAIAIEPSARPRFVVLNELYHPRWRAYDGDRELPVLCTNVFMRGVEIPPGVERISLRFRPFVKTSAALWPVLAGLIVCVAGGLFLKRLGRGGARKDDACPAGPIPPCSC